MRGILRHRLVIAGVALAFAVAGGGAAYAATQSTTSPRSAFLNDVAKRLNVSPQRLRSALQAAAIDRLDAAVKAGRLTRAQANAIKQRMEGKGAPFIFGPGGGAVVRPPGLLGGPRRFGPAGPLGAAAGYLGLSQMQLFNDLRSGRSLAQIAKSRGKSVSGLERAITAAIKPKLDHAVAAGVLTKSQEQQLLSRLSSRLGDLTNRTPPAFGPMRGGPPGPWLRPAPVPPL